MCWKAAGDPGFTVSTSSSPVLSNSSSSSFIIILHDSPLVLNMTFTIAGQNDYHDRDRSRNYFRRDAE